MLLSYRPKNDHIKIIPLIPVSAKAKEVKITRNQVQLLPGTNEISDDEWLVIKDHIKRELEAKIIVPIEKKVTASKRAPEGTAKNLAEMPSSEAVSIVEKCTNPETLTKWYQEETRDEVRFRIIEQMKEMKMEIPKLSASGKDDEDGDEDSDTETEKALEKMTKEELVSYAAEKKITVPAQGTVAEILASIKKAEGK